MGLHHLIAVFRHGPSTSSESNKSETNTTTRTHIYNNTVATMTANGQATDSKPSPFANVALAIDAYTLDAASGKRKLRTIEPDGSLTFEEPYASHLVHC